LVPRGDVTCVVQNAVMLRAVVENRMMLADTGTALFVGRSQGRRPDGDDTPAVVVGVERPASRMPDLVMPSPLSRRRQRHVRQVLHPRRSRLPMYALTQDAGADGSTVTVRSGLGRVALRCSVLRIVGAP